MRGAIAERMFGWPLLVMMGIVVGAIRYSESLWIRSFAVVLILGNLVFGVLGVQSASRAAMIDDHDLMERRVAYIDAYRAGLDAAHSIAMSKVPTVLESAAFLAILALVPRRRDGSVGSISREGIDSILKSEQ
jgi:hypothetical protein